MRVAWMLVISGLFSGCVGLPDGVRPVQDFELNRYLGKWYEIARLDHSFERGLDNVMAEYSLRNDGGVRVINKGFSRPDNEWREAKGKAYFVSGQNVGHLKVSFFGPFYGSYVVFELDQANYQYAFVAGYDKSYLWLLARTPTVDKAVVDKFVSVCRQLGFNTDSLIYVQQDIPK